MANQLGKINHIVLLMLENRSFDQMLGFLYHDRNSRSSEGEPFDGLTRDEWNPDDLGRQIKVFPIQASDPHPYLMPGADPGEGYLNVNYQLYGTDDPDPGMIPSNKGFVLNFKSAIASDLAKHYRDTIAGTEPSQIMGMYTPQLLPVLSTLAKEYAVCDAWFSSVPSMTLPNRAFALAATSQGHMDNHIKIFTCPSIFGRLSDKGLDWAIFGYNRDPLTHTISRTCNPLKKNTSAILGTLRRVQPRARYRPFPFSNQVGAQRATASIPITTSQRANNLFTIHITLCVTVRTGTRRSSSSHTTSMAETTIMLLLPRTQRPQEMEPSES